MKINEKEYKKKAQHIVKTVVKPQDKNNENKNRNAERDYYAAIGTMILITVISITLIIAFISNI